MKYVACICAKELKENIHLVDGTGWDKCRIVDSKSFWKSMIFLNKINFFVNISSLLLNMIIKKDEYNGSS